MRYVFIAAAAVLLIGLATIAFIPESELPTKEELEAAEEKINTPCYYFCGPWYTWIVTWLVGLVVVAFVIGVATKRVSY